tara:strand:+ start:15129 stop:27923 length:12795 start_codon:yes stop_codon:yes gene_type:complete
MTDQSTTPTTPSFVETPYSEWASTNVYEDPIESYGRYAEHVRKEYLGAGKYTEQVEQELSYNVAATLSEQGFLTADNQEQVAARLDSFGKPDLLAQAKQLIENPSVGVVSLPDAVLLEKAKQEGRSLASIREDAGQDLKKLSEFVTGSELGEEFSEEAITEAREAVRNVSQKLYTELYKRGEINAAVYEDKEGNEIFIGGRIPAGMSEKDVLEQSAGYGVRPQHLFNLRHQRKQLPHTGNLMRHEVQERQLAQVEVESIIAKANPRTQAMLWGLAKEYGTRTTWDWGDKLNHSLTDGFGDAFRAVRVGWNWLTGDTEEENELRRKDRLDLLREEYEADTDRARNELILDLQKQTNYSRDVLEDVVHDITVKYAYEGDRKNKVSPFLRYTDNEDELGQNVHKTRYNGAFVAEQLSLLPKKFSQALDQAGLSAEQKEFAESQRQFAVANNFERASNALFKDDGLSEEWGEYLLAGRHKGLTNSQILEGFAEDADFSKVWHRISGVGSSIWEGITSIVYGVAAAFESEWGQKGLVSIQENNAHARQVASIFGMEMGAGQDFMEAIAPMMADATLTAVLTALTVPTAGTSTAAAAGYLGAKTTATASARAIISAGFRGSLKLTGKETVEEAAERIFKGGVLKGATKERTLSIIKAYNGQLAKKLGIGAASFIPAATRSGANTYGAVFKTVEDDLTLKHKNEDGTWEEGWSEERVKTEAHDAALGGAITGGIITGVLTAGMGAMGKGGLESSFLKGMSFRQVHLIKSNILGRNVGKKVFRDLLAKSLSKITRKHFLVEAPTGFLKSALHEGVEEGLDEFFNTLVTDAYTNENTSMFDRLIQTWHGFVLGAAMGGAGNLVSKAAKNIAPSRFLDRSAAARMERMVFEQYEKDAAEQGVEALRAAGAPVTANEVERVVRQYARAERPALTEPTLGELGDEVEQDVLDDAQDVASESTEEVSQQQLNEINAELQLKLNPESVDRENKKVDTASKQQPSVDPAVAGSEAATEIVSDEEGDATTGLRNITASHAAKNINLELKEEYELLLQEIDQKEEKYRKMELRLMQTSDSAHDRFKREMSIAEREGRIFSPAKATFLRKEALKRFGENVKAQQKSDKKGVTREDADALDLLAAGGYPHNLTIEQLDKLGVDTENIDKASLRSLTKELLRKVRKLFPIIPKSMPEGGASIPKIYGGTGSVYVSSDGRGVFNNDPVGMLTLLESNIAIPVSQDVINAGNINPAFRFTKRGTEWFVTDIMVRESGGLVSATTAFNRIGVLEEDYTQVSELANKLNQLRESVTIDENIKVRNPFNNKSKIKLSTLLKRSKDIGMLRKIVASDSTLNLNRDFVESTAIATSLDMQIAVYEYAVSVNNNQDVGSNVFIVPEIRRKHGNFFAKQQIARKKKAKRDLASIINPDTTLHRTDGFDVETNGGDSAYVPPRANPLPPIPESKISEYIGNLHDVASAALESDADMLTSAKNMLNEEVHGGKDVTWDYTPSQVFNELVHFFAKGNFVGNQRAVDFQAMLKANRFNNAQTLRKSLKLLALSSPTIESSPSKDSGYLDLIREELSQLVGSDYDVTTNHAIDFFKDIQKAVKIFHQRAVVNGRSMRVNAAINRAEIDELGLVDGDADSVITALEKIAAGKSRGQALIAKLLLTNKEFIKSVKFFITGSSAEYAGAFYVDGNGVRNVVINPARSSARGVADTLLHEYIHAFTSRILDTPAEARTVAENNAISRIDGLIKILRSRAARENAPAGVMHGLKNTEEFIAALLTSPKFQAYVKGIKTLQGERNFLQRVIDAISRLFATPDAAFQQAMQDALDLTQNSRATEPENESGFGNQVASKVNGAQVRRSRLASSFGMAEDIAANEALDNAAEEYFAWAVSYVPAEINVVMDNSTDVIAEWDGATQSIIFNGRRAAGKINKIVAEAGGKPIRREHILAAILNEEIAHSASFAQLSQAQIDAIIDGLSNQDARRTIEQYYPENERADAIARLESEDADVSRAEKFILAEEGLRIHAQKVLRGAETNEQINFLLENPSLIETFKQYLKNFLTKITYHRELKDVSPEMRNAVNSIVKEIRAMEMRYRLSPNGIHFDINNPEAALQQLLKQVDMRNSAVPDQDEMEDLGEGVDSPTLQSRWGADAGTDLSMDSFKVNAYPQELRLFKTKEGKLKGAPPQVKSSQDVTKLMTRLKKLTIEGSVGRYWYEDAAKKILEITNGDVVEAEKFIALLAIYSPQTGVEVNTYFAVRAYEQHANGVSREDYGVKTRVQDDKAIAVLYDGKPWAGRKTDNFYKNLMFHIVSEASPDQLASMQIDDAFLKDLQQPVTVDMWVYRALGYDTIGLTDAKGQGAFGFSEKLINRLAYALNENLPVGADPYQAHQIQAMIWTAIKARSEQKDVKKKTEAQSIKAGDLVYKTGAKGKRVRTFPSKEAERKHQLRWTRNALAAEGVDFIEASRSFDYFVNSMGLTATWEVIASEETEIGKRLAAMSLEEKMAFTEQAMQLIVDPTTGEDTLARDLGIAISTARMSMGGYAGGVTPNVLSTLYPNKPSGEYDDDAIRAYARALQFIFMQDAVPWVRYVKSNNQDVHYRVIRDGKAIQGGAKLATQEEAQRLSQEKNAKIDAPQVVKVEGGYQILNSEGSPYKLKSKQTKKMEEVPIFKPDEDTLRSEHQDDDGNFEDGWDEARVLKEADSNAQSAAEEFANRTILTYVAGNDQSHGFILTFDEDLTSEKEQEIQDTLGEIHPDLGFTKIDSNQVTVINFKIDYKDMLPELTDGAFATKLAEKYEKEATFEKIATVGEYGYHDWNSDPEGDVILSLSPRFTPDIQEGVRNRRERFLQISSDTEGRVTPRLQSRFGADFVLSKLNKAEQDQLGGQRMTSTGKPMTGTVVSKQNIAKIWQQGFEKSKKRYDKAKKRLEEDGIYLPELTIDRYAPTPASTLELFKLPDIAQWHSDMANFVIPEGYDTIAFVPCAATKPWCGATDAKTLQSKAHRMLYPSYNRIREMFDDGAVGKNFKRVYFVTISEPLGVVPQDRWHNFPTYDNSGLFTDASQQSGFSTQYWLDLPKDKGGTGSKQLLPFDEKAFDQAIDTLGEVISNFVQTNKKNNPNLNVISFVKDDKTKGSHELMVESASKFAGQDIVPAQNNYAKRAESGTAPEALLKTVLGLEGQVEYDPNFVVDRAQIIAKSPLPTQPRLQSRYGAGSYIPSELDADSVDFSSWIETLEIPLMGVGTYKSPSKMWRMFTGYADRDIMRFKEERDAFISTAKKRVEEFKEKHDRIIKEEEKERNITIPPELISRASGSNRGSQLSDAQLESVEAQFNKERSAANKEADLKVRESKLALAESNKVANAKKLRRQNHAELIADRNEALKTLLMVSPKAHALILDMRKLTDELSKIGNSLFSGFLNRKEEFKATFDGNGGIYITRRYRMFEDVDFIKQVSDEKDPTYATEREDAINFFADQYMDYHTAELMKNEMLTESEARAQVEADLHSRGSNARSMGDDMMKEFINAYEKNAVKHELEIYEGADGGRSIILNEKKFKAGALKALVNNLNSKKNIPSPLRKLLGEYGDEAGVSNISHTILKTASIMANQAFFNRVVEHGTKGSKPWLITREAYVEDLQKKPEDRQYANWDTLKGDEGELDWNPLKGYYASPEVIKDFRDLIALNRKDAVTKDVTSDTEYLFHSFGKFLHRATGLSLAAKTLGSVGFYVRNMMGNAMFFGPMQGYYGGIGKMFGEIGGVAGVSSALRESSMIVRAAKGSLAEMSSELSVLETLNVWGDEMEAGALRDLLTGKMTTVDVENKIAKLAKDHGGKVKKGYDSAVKLATRLASAMDAYYKIGLYEFELETLIEAAKADSPNGKYRRLLKSDGTPSTDMKRAAAIKVKRTSQSYSQAPPLIKALTRSSAGLLIAPYVRFAAEIPRVIGNTYSLMKEEKNDPNPVIRKRGLKRRRGVMATTSFTFGLPVLLRLLAGIGEDEDEALRKGLPPYLRGHTFFYIPLGEDDLFSLDLTYLNPFSVVADPIARAGEQLFRGEPLAAVWALRRLFEPYVSEQILAKSVTQVVFNKNDYDQKIMYGDNVAKNISRAFLHIWEQAYEPRSFTKLKASINAALGDSTEHLSSPLGVIFSEFLPVKPHKVDLSKSLRNYLREHTGAYRDINNKFNRLLSKNLTDGQIEDIYDDILKTREFLNNDFRKTLRGYKGLGMSWREIHAQAKAKGVSKERLKLNYSGFMNRPVLSPFIQDKLKALPQGRDRIRKVSRYAQKYNRYISLDD